ncbi:MAG: hypothetical protein KDA41_10065 [Planctomycetales bacterium]|nr:hypothetical protein [Planctomycetales bacterium]
MGVNAVRRTKRHFWLSLIVALLATPATHVAAVRAETLVPAEHHEWGRFPSGSWKRVRLTSEKLDRDGQVISKNVSETTTTLVSVEDGSATLRVDSVVDVAGRQFAKQPQLVSQGFNGEVAATPVVSNEKVDQLGTDVVTIAGQRFNSEVRGYSCLANSHRWSTRVYYSSNVAPYVLRREIRWQDSGGQRTLYETVVEVTAVDVPEQVKGKPRLVSHVQTTHVTPGGKTITKEVRCEEVPGGNVAHTSQEFDKDGVLVGRSTLELVDYYVPSAPAAERNPSQQSWPQWRYRRWSR